MNTVWHHFTKIKVWYLWLPVLASLFITCSEQTPDYWPANGTTMRNTSWNVQLSDSSSILSTDNEIWILPVPTDTVTVETTWASYMSTKEVDIADCYKHVDQVVLLENSIINAEYYSFEKDGVYAKGYSTTDSSNLNTLYEPPLLFLPCSITNNALNTIHETTPKTWDAKADSFRTEKNMRIRLSVKSHGRVKYKSKILPAIWVHMSLSQDAAVMFGDNELLVPDASVMQSDVLLVESVGPIVEWGIRRGDEPPQDRGVPRQTEHHIRITVHFPLEE